MQQFVTRFVKDEFGATAIEYGLIAALIAVVLIAALTSLQTALSGVFTRTATKLDAAGV